MGIDALQPRESGALEPMRASSDVQMAGPEAATKAEENEGAKAMGATMDALASVDFSDTSTAAAAKKNEGGSLSLDASVSPEKRAEKIPNAGEVKEKYAGLLQQILDVNRELRRTDTVSPADSAAIWEAFTQSINQFRKDYANLPPLENAFSGFAGRVTGLIDRQGVSSEKILALFDEERAAMDRADSGIVGGAVKSVRNYFEKNPNSLGVRVTTGIAKGTSDMVTDLVDIPANTVIMLDAGAAALMHPDPNVRMQKYRQLAAVESNVTNLRELASKVLKVEDFKKAHKEAGLAGVLGTAAEFGPEFASALLTGGSSVEAKIAREAAEAATKKSVKEGVKTAAKATGAEVGKGFAEGMVGEASKTAGETALSSTAKAIAQGAKKV